MATTTEITASSFSGKVQTMLTGLTNDTPSSLKSMSVGRTSLTGSQGIGALESILTMIAAVTATKGTDTAVVATKKVALPAASALYENMVTDLKPAGLCPGEPTGITGITVAGGAPR